MHNLKLSRQGHSRNLKGVVAVWVGYMHTFMDGPWVWICMEYILEHETVHTVMHMHHACSDVAAT